MFVRYFSFVTLLSTFSYGADILSILPTPSYSHQIAYTELWKELSLRGHKVTLITTDPMKDPKLTNLTEIDMKWIYKFFSNISKEAEVEMNMWNLLQIMEVQEFDITEAHLTYAPVQDLIHKKKHFDVVMVEFFFVEFLGFAELYHCSKIVFSSLDAYQLLHHAMGNPTHPVLYPELGSPFVAPLSFKERILSTLYQLHAWYFNNYKMFARRVQLMQKYLNISQTLTDMLKDIDLLLLNVNPVISEVRAIGPTTINIGDHRRVVSSKPLPEDLAEFLDSANDGFIYFSFGSNIKSKDLKEESLNAIIETLREVPYKVLWKFEADDLPGKPPNVKLVKWAPQQTVLSHPNIKLFVTQGGLQSIEEAIYVEVPSVVIPFFGDQYQNARLIAKRGFAKVVGREPSISKDELKAAILEVINNPKYKDSVKRINQLALDTPMTGVEKGLWWIEYLIRNNGTKHLRNPTVDLPFYQFYLLDVIGFLVATTIVVLSVLHLLLRTVFKLLLNYIRKPLSRNKKIQ